MKTNHPTNRRRVACSWAAGLTGALLLANGANAADTIKSKVDVKPPTKDVTPDESRSVSRSATLVLKHVNDALDALAERRSDAAATAVGRGLTLIKIIDAALPASAVKTEITGDGGTYRSDEKIKSPYAPIFRDYESVDVLSLVPSAATTPARRSSVFSRGVPLTASPQVVSSTADYSAIKLDVVLARRELNNAANAIKEGKLAAATSDLNDILNNGVIFEFDSVLRPLARVMDNLRLSDSEMMTGDSDDARAALIAAREELERYEPRAGDAQGKEVKKLWNDINETEEQLAALSAVSFSERVSDMWGRVLKMF